MSETTNATTVAVPAKRKRVVIKAITTAFFREGPKDENGSKYDLAYEVMKAKKSGKDDASVELGEIIGQITGYQAKETITKQGEVIQSVMFLGTFRATRRFDGAQIDSPGLYLPNSMTAVFRAQCDSGAVPFMFGYDIDAIPASRADAAIPYEWQFANKMPITVHDPLEAISRVIEGGLSKPTLALERDHVPAAIEHDADHDGDKAHAETKPGKRKAA